MNAKELIAAAELTISKNLLPKTAEQKAGMDCAIFVCATVREDDDEPITGITDLMERYSNALEQTTCDMFYKDIIKSIAQSAYIRGNLKTRGQLRQFLRALGCEVSK